MKTMLRTLAFVADSQDGTILARAIEIANLLANEAGAEDERVITCAMLRMLPHAPSPKDVERLFGREVRDILDSLGGEADADAGTISRLSRRARLVLLAENICRLRRLVADPRQLWPLEKRQAVFDNARCITESLHGIHPQLERLFEEEFKLRPRLHAETPGMACA